MAKNLVKAIELIVYDSAGLTTSFQPLNPAGLDASCFYIRINNGSNRDITISYDGVTDHDFVDDTTEIELNFQQNASPNGYVALLAKGTIIYARAASAGTGNIYISGYYTPQGV